jgi:hypothetical protein
VASEEYASIAAMLKHHALIRLCRGRELLQESLGTVLCVGDIARRCGMSEYHFIRQFAALFGVTPHQYRLMAGPAGIAIFEKHSRTVTGRLEPITNHVALTSGHS